MTSYKPAFNTSQVPLVPVSQYNPQAYGKPPQYNTLPIQKEESDSGWLKWVLWILVILLIIALLVYILRKSMGNSNSDSYLTDYEKLQGKTFKSTGRGTLISTATIVNANRDNGIMNIKTTDGRGEMYNFKVLKNNETSLWGQDMQNNRLIITDNRDKKELYMVITPNDKSMEGTEDTDNPSIYPIDEPIRQPKPIYEPTPPSVDPIYEPIRKVYIWKY